jgi:diguanylate cyclase (GGDEF)-like protein
VLCEPIDGEAAMTTVAPLAELERGLETARTASPGSATELAALVELASRMVRDPYRRADLAREGLALAASVGDDVARLRCRAMLAEAQARQDHPAEALPDALAVLAEAEQVGHPQASAQAHHAAAHCFDALDCTPEALEHVNQAHDDYRRAGDLFGEGRILSFMASLFSQLGEDARARDLYERAHEILLECDDPSGAGVMLACVAGFERDAGDLDAAVATCEQSLARFAEAGMTLDSVIAMTEYAQVHAAMGQHEEAGRWARKAQERNRLPGGGLCNPSYEIDILLTLAGSAQIPLGEYEAAIAALRRAVELADHLGAVRYTSSAESMLAEALHASGDVANAYEHLRRSRLLTEEIAHAAHDRRVRALRVRFEVEQVQREALRYRDQALAQAEVINELTRTKAELAARMEELERLHSEVIALSQTDPLTGIANRRRMNERLAEFSLATGRHGVPLSLAIFDVDRFKGINDRYGHEVGDAVLVALAELMCRHLRNSDLPARLGGDEFVIVMPYVTGDEAVHACERLQAEVRAYPWHRIAPDLAVRITIGVADGTGQADPDAILRAADAALYRGKNAGRDTVGR